MRGIMILFVLVCVMSLTMAHPQQSLSPTQSLRTEARFAKVGGSLPFIEALKSWRGKAKKKYCAIRTIVTKAAKKHPIAFFVAQTAAKIGTKTLIGIATLGISEVALEIGEALITGYETGKDYAESLSGIKASSLTTSAKMACGTLSTAAHIVRFEFTLTFLQ